MPEIKIQSAGDDKYLLWLSGVKQSGVFTLTECMQMISTAEEMEQKEKAGE